MQAKKNNKDNKENMTKGNQNTKQNKYNILLINLYNELTARCTFGEKSWVRTGEAVFWCAIMTTNLNISETQLPFSQMYRYYALQEATCNTEVLQSEYLY